MKTKLTTLIAILFCFTLSAQIKTINITENKINGLSCEYSKSIDLEKGDTLYYIFLGFQNANYSNIIDIKSLFFKNNTVLKQFIKDLTAGLNEMDNKATSISWARDSYTIDKHDFSTSLYISESKGTGGYFIFNKKSVNKLLKWLYRIDFGSDILLPDTKD